MAWLKSIMAILPGIVSLLNSIFSLFKKSTYEEEQKAKVKVNDKIDEMLEKAKSRK